MNPDTTPTFDRRRALGLLGLGSVALIAGCASDSKASSSSTASTVGTTPDTGTPDTSGAAGTTPDTSTAATGAVDASTATPAETGGPFPADGTNDNGAGEVANVLADSRSVRTDIRSDLDGSNTQDGVAFDLTVQVVQQGDGSPLANAAVYIWHCNKDGEYSEYNSQMLGGDFSDRSFLRGVQVTDRNGLVHFTTILPGRYQGRAFHIHFEVYGDSSYGQKLLTSQMAIDDDLIDQLYADTGSTYATSLRNDTDNSRDNIFNDGVDHQLLAVSGDVTSGLRAQFTAVV